MLLTDPDNWDNRDPCRKVQLSPSSSEYQEVLKNVRQTAGASVKQIVKVCFCVIYTFSLIT